MSLSVENVSHEYFQGNRIIDDFSISVKDGEIIALVGPSGCGKTTLLHCITGLVAPTSGRVQVEGVDVSHKKPHERGIGIMMQDQPLYEHLSIEQNIAFPLRARGQKKPDVSQLLEQLELAGHCKAKSFFVQWGRAKAHCFWQGDCDKTKRFVIG